MTGVFLAVAPSATTGPGYWLVYLLVASLAALLPVVVVAGYRQLRSAGAWEQTRQDVERVWPDMKKVKTIVLGDEDQWPPVPSLAHQVNELNTQMKLLNGSLSTGNGKKLGETVMSMSLTLAALQRDLQEHIKASDAVHRQLEAEIRAYKAS